MSIPCTSRCFNWRPKYVLLALVSAIRTYRLFKVPVDSMKKLIVRQKYQLYARMITIINVKTTSFAPPLSSIIDHCSRGRSIEKLSHTYDIEDLVLEADYWAGTAIKTVNALDVERAIWHKHNVWIGPENSH